MTAPAYRVSTEKFGKYTGTIAEKRAAAPVVKASTDLGRTGDFRAQINGIAAAVPASIAADARYNGSTEGDG